jgi:hypothetical protein
MDVCMEGSKGTQENYSICVFAYIYFSCMYANFTYFKELYVMYVCMYVWYAFKRDFL